MAPSDTISKSLEDYFKQWNELGERMNRSIASIRIPQEQLQRALKPILESQKAFQKALQPILAEQKSWKTFPNSFEMPKVEFPDLTLLIKSAEELRRLIDGLISPVFEQLQRSFQELPPKMQEALILLGNHGWYFDLEMSLPALWELKKVLTECNILGAEEALIKHFENRLDEIEKSIIKRFPNREKLIRAAFNAHRREEYELSIPVLLSQTDGICKEVVNEHLFLKHKKKPRTAIYVQQIATDTYRAALLSPLAQTLPIAVSERERDKEFSELNRHMVLHGESLDYGTKINGLKAVSLINYVVHVLKVDDDNP